MDDTDDNTDLGRRLRAAREYSGRSRKQIGDSVGRSDEQIGRYERGQNTPDDRLLESLADATGVPHWFLTAGFDHDENVDTAVTDDMLQFMALMNSIDLEDVQGVADIGGLITWMKVAVLQLTVASEQQRLEIQALIEADRRRGQQGGEGQG